MTTKNFILTLIILPLSFLNMIAQSKEQTKEINLTSQISYSTEEVFKVVEQMPRFSGCENLQLTEKEKSKCGRELLDKYIQEKITIKKDENGMPLDFMAVVQFIVDEKGKPYDIKLIRSVANCDDCNKEILNIMKEMPMWIPGRQRDIAVKVLYTYPIKLKFEKSTF